MPKKTVQHVKTEKPAEKNHYSEAVGRRKTAVARVRIFSGKGDVKINGKDIKVYFPVERLCKKAVAPLESLNLKKQFDVTAKAMGGGIAAQADAVCHGIARALIESDKELRVRLKKMGYLTRDSRMVERKKYGLKKARRAPQWRKR